MRTKLAVFAATILGVVGFAVMPAFARATVTIRHAGGGAALNTTTDTVKAFSPTLEFETALGNLQCTESTLTGKLTVNTANPAKATVSSATFTGTSGAQCPTTIGGGAVTATITAAQLPWTLEVAESGTSTLKGGPNVRFTAQLFEGVLEVGRCVYQNTTVKSEIVKFGSTPLQDKVKGQEFTLLEGTELCSETGELKGTFTLTANGSEMIEATKP
jgi:hypothetical protein